MIGETYSVKYRVSQLVTVFLVMSVNYMSSLYLIPYRVRAADTEVTEVFSFLVNLVSYVRNYHGLIRTVLIIYYSSRDS